MTGVSEAVVSHLPKGDAKRDSAALASHRASAARFSPLLPTPLYSAISP